MEVKVGGSSRIENGSISEPLLNYSFSSSLADLVECPFRLAVYHALLSQDVANDA